MDLSRELSDSLWASVQTKYEAGDYTGAILDAIYYLGDFVRDRTGLESDGVALAGEAFGGQTPRLRVNRLSSESERNVQKGVQNLLLGIFQGIRNPRSHTKYVDSKEDAESIIVFVDYLVRVIGVSKGAFSKGEFVRRVFDRSFVESAKYARLLVEEIPRRYRLDVMIDVFARKDEGEPQKLKVFASELIKTLDEDEISNLADVVSNDLAVTDEKEAVRLSAVMFPAGFWIRLSEAARMRCENVFIQSIRDGKYLVGPKKCVAGALGTWCAVMVSDFVMRNECVVALIEKLTSDTADQDYVFAYFGSGLLSAVEKEKEVNGDYWGFVWLVEVIKEALEEGDERFYSLARSAVKRQKGIWVDALKESYDSFQAAGVVPQEEEEPEDIPF